MAFRKFLGWLLAGIISNSIYADSIRINPDHPDHYTITNRDTLWDVAAQFLQQPWQWQQLWQNNGLQPPKQLYSGDTLYFSQINGKPQLSLSNTQQTAEQNSSGELNIQSTCVLHEDSDHKTVGRTQFPVSPDGKLQPCIRETNLKQAIKLIPTDSIAQFLTSPRVVDANELNTAPYVVELAGEHLIAGTGDKVYVRAITDSKNLTYTIYRAGDIYKNPETGEILGYEARHIAETSLEQTGDPASLVITDADSEIRMGDRVMPTSEEDITLNYLPRPPAKQIHGTIIGIPGGVTQIGLYNTVVIDKGTQDGLQVGHELSIYQKGRLAVDRFSAAKDSTVKLPDERAGVLMVFRPFERVSYALVMKANQSIHLLDKVHTPESH